MRYVDRGDAPEDISTGLEAMRLGVLETTDASAEWRRFGRMPLFQRVGEVLRGRFRNKCGYCESARTLTIDHFWPKSPDTANGRRGTPLKMYHWENLVPACRDCQSFECKGAKLLLDEEDRSIFIDPCSIGDDPIRYVEVTLPVAVSFPERDPVLPEGWLQPRESLGHRDASRAAVTIEELKLNEGRKGADLWEQRARGLGALLTLLDSMRNLGPDFAGISGKTIRHHLAEALSDRTPYLAGTRQLLWAQPNSEALRIELVTAMPELRPLIDALAPAADDSN